MIRHLGAYEMESQFKKEDVAKIVQRIWQMSQTEKLLIKSHIPEEIV